MNAIPFTKLPIAPTQPVLDGRTLNGDQPCVLMHAVRRCPPRSAYGAETQEADRLSFLEHRNINNRFPSPARLSEIHDNMLAFAEHVQREWLVPEPYPNKCQRPSIPFIASEYKFEGTIENSSLQVTAGHHSVKDMTFKKKRGRWIAALEGTERPLSERPSWYEIPGNMDATQKRTWNDKVKEALRGEFAHKRKLRCVSCRRAEIGDHDFVLCELCVIDLQASVLHWFDVKTDSESNVILDVDSGFAPDSADPNFSEDLANPARDVDRWVHATTAKTKPRPTGAFFDDQQPYSDEDRPLSEYELAVILATKYSGFTKKGSPAYRKAQKMAAQLVGRYLCGHSYPDLVQAIPRTTEKSITRACDRARRDYQQKLWRQPMPDEARDVLRTEFLRCLYPRFAMCGYQTRIFWRMEDESAISASKSV